MSTNLVAIEEALAGLTDPELRALAAATYGAPQFDSGLLAWLGQACGWEWNRRAGYDYALQPPEAAIPPGECAVSIDSAISMRNEIAKDSRALHALFDALLARLTGAGRKR